MPATPQQWVHDDRRVTEIAKAGLLKERVSLDPFELLRSIRQLQEELVNLSDGIVPGSHGAPDPVTLEKFLARLKIAWESGPVIRPTHRRKASGPRGRRRPDPVETVTAELMGWFAEEPRKTGRQLLERLQTTYPDKYKPGLIRTIQRRVKGWRAQAAEALYAASADASPLPPDRAAMGTEM